MSIKEDIKFTKKYMQDYFCEDIAIEDDFKFEKAIKNILADRERLEKENLDLKEKYRKALSDLAEATHKRIVEGAENEC